MERCFLAARASIIGGGMFAAVLLISGQMSCPLLCLVQIEGHSMEPTLHSGCEALFARLPWTSGDIILADVGESSPVVKRVAGHQGDYVLLQGDNRVLSADYLVSRQSVEAVLLCRTPLTTLLPREREPKQSDFPLYPHGSPELAQSSVEMWQAPAQERTPPVAKSNAAARPDVRHR